MNARLAAFKERVRDFLARSEIQLFLASVFGLASIAIALGGSQIAPFELRDANAPVEQQEKAPLASPHERGALPKDAPFAPSMGAYPEAPPLDVIGGRASRDIRATHNFKRIEMESVDAEQRRREAIQRVHPIWVFDPGASVEINTRVAGAFTLMRTPLCNRVARSIWDEDSELSEDEFAAQETQRIRQCVQRGLDADTLSAKERKAAACDAAMLTQIRDRLRVSEFTEETCNAIATEGATLAIQLALQNYISFLMMAPVVENQAALRSLEETIEPTKPVAEHGFRLMLSHQGELTRADDAQTSIVTDLELYQHVVQVREAARSGTAAVLDLPDGSRAGDALRNLAATLVHHNTTYDAERTEAARVAAVESITHAYEARIFHRGELILAQDGTITGEIAETLAQMSATAPRVVSVWWEAFALALLLLLASATIWLLTRDAGMAWSTRDITMMGLVLVVQVALVRFGFYLSDFSFLENENVTMSFAILAAIPFAAGSLVVKTLTNTRNALVFTMLSAVLVAAISSYEFAWFACSLVSGAVAAAALSTGETRKRMLGAGAAASAAIFVLVIAFGARGMLDGAGSIFVASLAALIGFIVTSLFVLSLPAIIEFIFGYMTPQTMQELASTAHPLRRILAQAPGTTIHSDSVADLASRAAESIGANALLAHVGAIYHDIGKTRAPQYFGENNIIPNVHDNLSSRESAKRIIAHVPDGIEIAKRHRLPEEIIEFIRTHHGTMLVRHFYNTTCNEEGETNVDADDFRYPGPKPSTKETAICLMADGLEAAVRANPDKSHERIAQTVKKMLDDITRDGQLDESGLTFAEVKLIEESFIATLKSIHHSRPVYASKVETTPVPAPGLSTTTPQDAPNTPDAAATPGADGADGAANTPERGE